MKISPESLTEGEREELLKYFEQWSETLPAMLLGALQNAVTLTHHHQVHCGTTYAANLLVKDLNGMPNFSASCIMIESGMNR